MQSEVLVSKLQIMGTMLRNAMLSIGYRLCDRRWSHFAVAAPLERAIDHPIETTFVLPEFNGGAEKNPGIEIPHFPFGASMELMAVPKKKVSRYKRGLRNGPKALKPVPVIVRCKSCGRVKLPHFYCCSGERGTGERSGSGS
ncbi:ribosomal L32p protein family [Tasmannia lanceolata]|uniref:ribosomal L32p protein family n=1 Tax=Tasmannia lanceolata TaxID=3420 RepID=UPI004063C2C2